MKRKKTVDIRFVIENSQNKILPSMFGKVKIEKDSKEILVLPKSAVIKNQKIIMYLFQKKMESLHLKK